MFGVHSGKLFGYMTTHRGIKASTDQVRTIVEMSTPGTKNEIYLFTSILATLAWFISRYLDKGHPFIKVVQISIRWSDECE